MKTRLAAVVLVFLAAGHANGAGMIRHVSIFQPPVGIDQFDPWYFGVHSQECVAYYGPWLTRYVTWRSLPVPDELNVTIYRGRYTELWYENVEAWREADPYRRRSSTAPWPGGGLASPDHPSASMLVPANPTDDFLRKEPVPSQGPYVRVLTAVRYPSGVSVEDGEKWYREVHAREAAKLPGLLRYVSFRAVKDSPLPSTWIRFDEMWFRDYAAWKRATEFPGFVYTDPPWVANGRPPLETVTTFVGVDPDKDFLK